MDREFSKGALDSLDLMLIKELEVDARQSYSHLAAKLGTTPMTVYRRLQRLFGKRVIDLAAIAAPIPLGYKRETAMAIKVETGKVSDVVDQLAVFRNVQVILITTGRYDIITWTISRDEEDLLNFFSKGLGSVRGITNAEMLVLLKKIKNLWGYFRPDEPFLEQRERSKNLDELDLLLIRELEAEPRKSITKLAKKVGISMSSVKRRLYRLQGGGFMRIVSIPAPAALGYSIRAVILFKAEPRQLAAIANKLSHYSSIMHIGLTAGRFDIYAWAVFKDERDMSNFLISELGTIPGIMHYETAHILKVPKVSFAILAHNDHD